MVNHYKRKHLAVTYIMKVLKTAKEQKRDIDLKALRLDYVETQEASTKVLDDYLELRKDNGTITITDGVIKVL